MAAPTWFMVKYGENESAIFNSDSWAVVLIDHIKVKCGHEGAPEEFDLLKEDNSRLNLRSIGTVSAKDTITPKGTYILAKINVDESGAESVEQMWTPPEGYEAPAAGKGGPGKGKK